MDAADEPNFKKRNVVQERLPAFKALPVLYKTIFRKKRTISVILNVWWYLNLGRKKNRIIEYIVVSGIVLAALDCS